MTTGCAAVEGPLAAWRQEQSPSARTRREDAPSPAGIRFVFYGRLSTKEHQDCDTSRRWQLECAHDLIAGTGTIVAEYLDVGCSRRRSWQRRPEAAALLAAVTAGGSGFDAVVVGEYERAFCGRQVFDLLPVLRGAGVGLWLPELLGPVDADDPAHRAVLIELGARSQREVQRARHRVMEAMRVQTRDQGRYLGGRPPYGYLLADAGPHPNPTHAGWGRKLRRLEPDPVTARHVRWIFARRLAGHSMADIACALNTRGVPCPSAHDRGRNRHRRGAGWQVRSVAAILENPRYTGRQVWNRQSQHTDLAGPAAGEPARGRNQRDDWVISRRPAHRALISEADFVAAQKISALATPEDGAPRRPYRLTGLLICVFCERRMEPHWAHGRAWYRCRHGADRTKPAGPGTARAVYVREDRALAQIVEVLSAADAEWNRGRSKPEEALRRQELLMICGRDEIGLHAATGVLAARQLATT
jgi:site-specific DNA recombinase